MRALLGIFTCILLAGCGIKPGSVAAPDAERTDTFPRTYPNVATDPSPAANNEE